jgi:hypothetical protein
MLDTSFFSHGDDALPAPRPDRSPLQRGSPRAPESNRQNVYNMSVRMLLGIDKDLAKSIVKFKWRT